MDYVSRYLLLNLSNFVLEKQKYEIISKKVLELDKIRDDIGNVSKKNHLNELNEKNVKTFDEDIDKLKREK